jgi:hypothetical protein
VNVEGASENVDCSSLGDIHAIQWYGTHGEIEYFNPPGKMFGLKGPTHFDDFEPFQYLVDAWEVEAQKLIEEVATNAA